MSDEYTPDYGFDTSFIGDSASDGGTWTSSFYNDLTESLSLTGENDVFSFFGTPESSGSGSPDTGNDFWGKFSTWVGNNQKTLLEQGFGALKGMATASSAAETAATKSAGDLASMQARVQGDKDLATMKIQADKDTASALLQSQKDLMAENERLKKEADKRYSESITGMKPLIGQPAGPLKRLNGQNVFTDNGLLNRAPYV